MDRELDLFKRRIEEVSLNAWPALQQILFDGWVLRFSRGFTKRANSVNPLYPSRQSVEAKVDVCEELYTSKKLPTIFRLTPFASPMELDQILDRRKYKVLDPTFVLTMEVGKHDLSPMSSDELRVDSLEDWQKIYAELTGVPFKQLQAHEDILKAIPSPRLLMSLSDSGQVVACGMGVLEDEVVGLFDLFTARDRRNQGFGTQLVGGLIKWARENGARWAYLQVMQDNEAGLHLYSKFSFTKSYSYWYRVNQ